MYIWVNAIPEPRRQDLVSLITPLMPVGQTGGYHTTDPDRTTALLEPVLADLFPGPWVYSLLVILPAGGALALHTDGVTDRIRKHVVLQTNPGCWVRHDTDWQQLESGGIYMMDPMKPHGAVNWGSTDRIHLLVDVTSPKGAEAPA